jgi:hypothetical protein
MCPKSVGKSRRAKGYKWANMEDEEDIEICEDEVLSGERSNARLVLDLVSF